MRKLDYIAEMNMKRWEKAVRNPTDMTTKPWLNLDLDDIRKFANGTIEYLKVPGLILAHPEPFENASEKKVLLLATGGGQQSAIFGLLGANVTVFDLCKGQLESDKKAAKHYGYEIQIIQGDMRDLSVILSDTYDIVYQGISLIYIDDVGQVFREVSRILKRDGLYRIKLCNNAVLLVDETSWDGVGYRVSNPYQGGRVDHDDEKWGVQFRHLYCDIFCGLYNAGFIVKGVWEDPSHLIHDPIARPGTIEHLMTYIPMYFEIMAFKANIIQR